MKIMFWKTVNITRKFSYIILGGKDPTICKNELRAYIPKYHQWLYLGGVIIGNCNIIFYPSVFQIIYNKHTDSSDKKSILK